MLFPKADIRRAFDEDEFFPVFQPQVELRTGRLVGFEVLARCQHKKLGAIRPDDFIPAVEKCGFIDQLTQIMLEKAFRCPVLRDGPYNLAVNISPRQLLGLNLAERLMAVAAEGCFPLSRLTIEITESALVDDLERAEAAARALKALQCKLALDDFGTGYSSLKHLHALPLDELKVDRNFVNSMAEDRESRKIVAAVVGLGQSLGLETVAEGVETQEQANMLLWLGCDLGQGWLFGKPCTADALPGAVANMRHPSTTVVMPANPDGDSVMSLGALPSQRLAQLQAIYDGAPVGLCFLDRKMRYVSLNKRLSEMNGVPAAEHLGKTVAEVTPKVFPVVEPFIRRAMQGDPVTGVEVKKPPAEGETEGRTILLSYQPARDEAGEILGVCVAVMDITESRRTEVALRETEDHYRHMMQLGPHVPWVLDAKGEVIDASPRWECITGQTRDEAMGRGWLKMLHPDDMEPTKEAIRTLLRTGLPIDIEYRVRKPDGDWIRMRSRGAPRFGPNGKIIYVYGVVEQEHGGIPLTDELRAHEIALHAALDTAPFGIILADASDGSIFMINAAAEIMLGGDVRPGQTVADYAKLHVSTPDGRRLQFDEFPIVRATLHGEAVAAMQILYERSDGKRIPLCAASKPIYSDHGHLIGGLLILRDAETEPSCAFEWDLHAAR
jgi:PAS domain S-box-containing protein